MVSVANIRKNPMLLSQYNEIILDKKEHHIIEEAYHIATNAIHYVQHRPFIRGDKVATPV